MKFTLLLFATLAFAQGPPITINQTQVQGGIANDCLKVNSNKTLGQATCGGGGGGSGTVTSVATSNGITGGTITTSGTISGVNAAANGTTKGVSAFTAADFDASAGVISLDYTNGQKASGSQPGFLSSADWTTFNSKGAGTVTSVATTSPLGGGTITGTGTLTCTTCTTSAAAVTDLQIVSGAGSQALKKTNISTDSGLNNLTLPAGGVLTAPGGVSTGTSPPSVTAGTGGAQGFAEGTVPSVCAASAVDCIYADSTQHGFLANFNNVGYLPLVQGPASWTTARVVSTNGTNGGKIADAGFLAADVVRAVAPGAGICHFAGSTQVCTSSLIVNADITNSTIDLTAKVTGVLPNANTTAASANTASAIVARDSSGNFSAGTITATLTGTASGNLTRVFAGTKALATGAISSAACTSAQTVAATGVVTTDIVTGSFNGDPTGVTGYVPLTAGMLTIIMYPTSDTINIKVCNNTTGSITPGAITLNVLATR